jgi:beta-fructofuranosidase
VRTSRDLLRWSDPVTVFSLAAGETGGPESPTLLALHGGFYLVWCRWDAKRSLAGVTYQDRSFVFYSDNPLNFRDRDPVAEIQGHAPELFQDEDGGWWISSAERPYRGVSIAPITWERPTPRAAR